MVGVVITYQGRFCMAVAESADLAESIVVQLFAEEGIDISDEEVSLFLFDPASTCGIILGGDVDMSGWSPEGYKPA